MIIERHGPNIETSTIEEFAEKHGIVMEVHDRGAGYEPHRYYAQFKRAEVSQGSLLLSVSGRGDTEEEAIADYAREISGEMLVINAYSDARREIIVPIIVNTK